MALGRVAIAAQLLFCLIVLSSAACPSDSVAGDDGECKCVSPCPKHDCQPGLQPVRVKDSIPDKPGFCCPLYECHKQAPLSYAEPEKSGSECFDDAGQPRDSGETWHDEDPCKSCVCEAGRKSCHITMCRSCTQPLPPLPGECCPRCPAPPQAKTPTATCPTLQQSCPLRPDDCRLGLDVDEAGCKICRCKSLDQNEVTADEDEEEEEEEDEDEEGEEEDGEEEEKVDCPRSDCELDCRYERLLDGRGCRLCQCRPHLGCPARFECERDCPHGYSTDKLGCPTCSCLDSCLDERNVTRPEGTSWRVEPCRSCACELGGRIFCNETICSVACNNPLPPPPGHCCPVCPTSALDQWRGWSTIPLVLIVVLALLCVVLMVHLVRGRFRGRLVPSEADFMGFSGHHHHHHQQYYKCVPIYETHVPVLQHAEKIVPL